MIADDANMSAENKKKKKEMDDKDAEAQAQFKLRADKIKKDKEKVMTQAFKGMNDGAISNNPEFRKKKKVLMRAFDE